jgi:AcrR family transcriptional regulator
VANTTISHVVARSGVSRRTFYEIFEDREDCFLAASADAVLRIAAMVVPVYETGGSSWRARVRSGLRALLGVLDREPSLARLLIVESLGAGPKVLKQRQSVLAEIIAIVDRGRVESTRGQGPPPLVAEGAVGGALSLIHARMVAGEGPLVELLNPLMAMIVLPYLGPAAARRELSRPAAAPRNATRRLVAPVDPLRELDMRLTYRTVRVLVAIGELNTKGYQPSNRKVADAAGIRDQGQISKLLTRLEHLGLIHNTGDSHAKGEPNAWTLTEHGERVQTAITP